MLNENMVLQFYLERLEEDKISFLKNKEELKEKIKVSINELKEEDRIHEKIEISKNLWKFLFEGAMSYIDKDKSGYDKLFEYFDKYVKFEELIFASDSFYRDHTMHCLWVYFLGEYIRCKDEFKFLVDETGENNPRYKNLKRFEEVLSGVSDECNRFVDTTKTYIRSLEGFEALMCVAALTHDLGYPIKKVTKINKCMKEIMPFFSIYNLDEFNFQYENIQQKYIDNLIFIMSLNLYIEANFDDAVEEFSDELKEKIYNVKNEKEFTDIMENFATEKERRIIDRKLNAKVRYNRCIDNEIRYTKDFENYNHGIMSAYLLMNTLSSFKNIGVNYSNMDNVRKENFNFNNYIGKSAILKAVTDHTSEGFKVSAIRSVSDYLLFIDELEEFSRISRANKNRQYVNEFCKTEINAKDGYFCVDFIFDSLEIENLDPEFAFKGRCKRFLKTFDIEKLAENVKLKLRCIGKLPYDNSVYELEIRNKYAHIKIDGKAKNIPQYLKTSEFLTTEEYGI